MPALATTDGSAPDAAQSAVTEPTGDASYEEAPCPAPNVPGFPAADLGPEYTCGFLTVPETRSDAGGRTVRIAVATVAAVSATPSKDPIVYLDGGPGNTGLVSAPRAVAAGMNADRDVIFVDQRGTYHSDPFLSCPEEDAFYAEVVAMAYSDPATGEKSDAATAACRDRLAAEGIALASYDTAENAADIADLRVAMGIDEWNLYGVSYGTDLALTVLRDHPDGIRSVVLDSVVPPNLNIIPAFWPAAAAAYDELFAACAGQAACAAAYPDLEAEFTETVNRLDAEPLVVPVSTAPGETVEVTIDGYKFANAVVLLLAGGPAASADLPRMIHEIAAGDGAAVAATILSFVPPSGFVGLGLQWGVFCRESIPQTSLEEVVTSGRHALPEFPEGVLRLLPQVPRFFDDCAIWDVGAADAQAREAVVSDVPVLIMGGTFDAVTAPSWQDAATPGLNASQVVNFPGLGHQVFLQSGCPVSVMRAFIAAPDEPVDQTCVTEMAVPAFTVPDSGTTVPPVTSSSGGAGASDESPTPHADFSGMVAIGNGREMYLECQGSGAPTVVLVAGGGERGENWSATARPDQTGVFPEVAKFSRVCVYDRPGTATQTASGWDTTASTAVAQPITVADAAADLHALLQASGEAGPYVFVGHSLGGPIVRYYAGENPSTVAGVVLDDALSEHLGDPLTPEQLTHFEQMNTPEVQGRPPGAETFKYSVLVEQMQAAGPMPDVPMIILTADTWLITPEAIASGAFPDFVDQEFSDALWSAQLAAQDELAATYPDAEHITDTDATHYIHVDQPQLVIDAIRHVRD